MTEAAKRESNLKIISRNEVKTEFGMVARSEIVFRNVLGRVYYPAELTGIYLERYAEEVVLARQYAKNPAIISDLESKGTTPDQFIQEGSSRFIEDLTDGTYTFAFDNNPLTPLVINSGWERLFNEAQRPQKPPKKEQK